MKKALFIIFCLFESIFMYSQNKVYDEEGKDYKILGTKTELKIISNPPDKNSFEFPVKEILDLGYNIVKNEIKKDAEKYQSTFEARAILTDKSNESLNRLNLTKISISKNSSQIVQEDTIFKLTLTPHFVNKKYFYYSVDSLNPTKVVLK